MSLIPEFILQTTIVRGIKTLRADQRFIDQLFRNLDQANLQEIRAFVRQQAFDLSMNYPRKPLALPAIVVLLKAESEGQAFLGDELGIDTPDEFAYDGAVLGGGTVAGTASTSNLSGEGKVLYGPAKASGGTLNTIKAPTSEPDAWDNGQFLTVAQPNTVRILGGTGAGQIRNIVANGNNTLMVSPNWRTVPDTTSIFEVRAPPQEMLGEPSALYDRRANPTPQIARRGGLYAVQYQLQVITGAPESTIYLAMILKAILTLSRIFLESQGVINMKMSATDFLPRTEYVPDFAYMRAVNLDFLYPFDIFEDLTPQLAQQFTLAIENAVDDVVLSETTIPPFVPPPIPS